jgi:hypothetical protein
MKLRNILLSIATAIILTACAYLTPPIEPGYGMQELAADKAPVAPAPGKAVVVFLRPSSAAYYQDLSVFEVKDNQALLVGVVLAKTKVAYQVEPGKRVFMLVKGEPQQQFMTADLLPNRTYYVIVDTRWSNLMRSVGFVLEPVRGTELDSPAFESYLAVCRWVEKTSENWVRGRMGDVESDYAKWYPDWVKRPEAGKPHLSQGDGR